MQKKKAVRKIKTRLPFAPAYKVPIDRQHSREEAAAALLEVMRLVRQHGLLKSLDMDAPISMDQQHFEALALALDAHSRGVDDAFGINSLKGEARRPFDLAMAVEDDWAEVSSREMPISIETVIHTVAKMNNFAPDTIKEARKKHPEAKLWSLSRRWRERSDLARELLKRGSRGRAAAVIEVLHMIRNAHCVFTREFQASGQSLRAAMHSEDPSVIQRSADRFELMVHLKNEAYQIYREAMALIDEVQAMEAEDPKPTHARGGDPTAEDES